VIATGEPLGNMPLAAINGLQRLPAAGNNVSVNTSTSHLIDVDGETVGFDKLKHGDVEVYRVTCTKKWFPYCTAKVNSLGCVPSIDADGDTGTSSGLPFTVFCRDVRNAKSGLLFYSVTGVASTPFQGGTLCVSAPVRRTPGTNSGGTPPPAADCSGVLSIDMNAFAHGALGGSPLPALSMPGTVVDCQFWSRDPGASFNTSLSDALEYVVDP
jgi:hypothetical protein